MAVYLIVDVDAKEPSALERYRAEVPALIRKHGGEYLVRGGAFEVLEGDWQPTRLVLFRFPDAQSVRGFINDPEYQPLKALRHRVAKTSMVVVAGI
jgi:uncharacterized protein (DUF1330 family)